MRLLYSIFIIILALCSITNAATYNADSCNQSDVQDAIDLASIGDTVLVPSGTCTWNTGIALDANISLIGSGSDTTLITSGGPTLIEYNGTSPSETDALEIAHMSLSMGGYTPEAVGLTHNSNSIMQQLKIHDNIIKDCGGIAFYFSRLYSGVLYANNITTTGQFQQNVGGADGGLSAWDTVQKCSGTPLKCSHDDGRNMYLEDNTMDIGNTVMESGGAGFSYILRYNTITYHVVSPFAEWHGNYGEPTNRCSSMDMGIYGNNLIPDSGSPGPWIRPRGGMGMVFYNYANDSSDNTLRVDFQEENDLGNSAGPCSATTNTQPQNVSDTYVWVNEKSDGLTYSLTEVYDDYDQIEENTDWFGMREGTFDATGSATDGGGVGCGTLANIPSTCTAGVGYWATEQSCSDLTGIVGVNPSTPISGTLYKCTSTNTWESYYTPYTYPHPLRLQARNSGAQPLLN